ncbi:MAG: type II toxin-antitoxin system HicA family toxin [Christensenellaceae bacterium]|jgi:predicted RNA binding protein YcfA (HicA-like mRNA interferase family)|nr:type II toxin-antitoxin system HicA family toxin [Christensenellaceae bacterium]
MKGKDLVKKAQKEGWVIDRVHGSHYIMAKMNKTVSIPCHNKDLGVGIYNALLKQLGIKGGNK